MKVLVTGANGFLAGSIIRILISRGYDVRGMLRKNSGQTSLKGISFEKFTGEITNIHDVYKAVTGCDIIIHAAADTSHFEGNNSNQRQVNVDATRYMLNAAVEQHVKKFIFVSTANTIGHGSAKIPGTENNAITGSFLRSGYVSSKYEAEKIVLKNVTEKGLDAVIVHPSFMIGPYDSKPGSNRILLMYRHKKRILITGGGKSFIHVRDAATAICNAIENGRKGECYLLTNENLTFKEFFLLVSAVTGEKQKQIVIPDLPVLMGGAIYTLLNHLGIRKQFNLTSARMLCSRLYYDSSKAEKELRLPNTPIKEAIAEALEWSDKV